jgi:thiol-disulfide isomerase/thioredoxin
VALTARNGDTVTLPDAKAKLTYIDFWASWCGPCRQSFPWLNRMHARYAAKGLRIIGVNLDASRPDADKFLAEFPAQFDLVFDPRGASGKTFGLRGMPSAVLVGADGKIVAMHMGFRAGDPEELEAMIKAELARP